MTVPGSRVTVGDQGHIVPGMLDQDPAQPVAASVALAVPTITPTQHQAAATGCVCVAAVNSRNATTRRPRNPPQFRRLARPVNNGKTFRHEQPAHQAHLASRGPEERRAASLGRGNARGARPGHRNPDAAAQCDRRAFRFLFPLPRAGGGRRHAQSRSRAGPHGHVSGGTDRPTPAMGLAGPDRLHRSLRPHGQRGMGRQAAARLGHPPHDRGDQGAPGHAGVRQRHRQGDG